MKSWSVFVIGLKQKRRDWLGLSLTLFTAPLFVLLYWFLFGNLPTSIAIGMLSPGNGSQSAVQSDIIEKISSVPAADPSLAFRIKKSPDKEALEQSIQQGVISLGLILKESSSAPSHINVARMQAILIGDATSPNYHIAAALLRNVLQEQAIQSSGIQPPIQIEEIHLGLSGTRTPFETYVPGLLVFAVIMLVFSSSMSVVREVEAGTLARIRLSSVSSLSLLFGLSAVQLLLGVLSVIMTLLLAAWLGFESQGSFLLAMSIATLACIACVGMGMVVASLAKTQIRAFLIASAAMFLLVLFSGVVFPKPTLALFDIGRQPFDLFDVLPTTHMGSALGKVMTLGASAGDLVYEISCLSIIALTTFLLGAWLFDRSGKPSINIWEGLP